MATNLILYILLTSYVVLEGKSDTFCPLESTDCSQHGISCAIIRDRDCNISDNTKHYVPHYPGPVTDFMIQPYYLPPNKPGPYSNSRVEISWRPPQNDTHLYLQGFEVRLTQEGGIPQCFILNFSNPTWGNNKTYKYLLNCTLDNSGYTVDVTPLPKAPSGVKTSALVQIVNKFRDRQPDKCRSMTLTERRSCWDTDIVVYKRLCHHQLHVSFTKAPADLEIDKYTITLIAADSYFADNSTECVPEADDDFVHGTLTIDSSKLPLPLPGRNVRIIPRSLHCSNGGCRDSKTMDFTVQNVSTEECTFVATHPTLVPHVLPGWQLILFITMAVALAAIITVIIALCARNKCSLENMSACLEQKTTERSEGQSTGSDDSGGPLIKDTPRATGVMPLDKRRKHPQKRKSVYLVYSIDHQDHVHVIGCLENYLQKNCCDVISAISPNVNNQMRGNKEEWIKTAMDSCDYILIITSEGTYNKVHALCHNLSYSNVDVQHSYMGDMFIPAYKILQEKLTDDESSITQKLILAHFDYTKHPQIWLPYCDVVNNALNYRLMNNIEELCKHVDSEPGLTYHNDLNYENAEGGEPLAVTIKLATSFVQNHPYWFQERYGQPSPPIPHIQMMQTFTEQPYAQNASNIDTPSFADFQESSAFQSPWSRPKSVGDTSTLGDESMCDAVDSINNYKDSGFGRSSSFRNETSKSQKSHIENTFPQHA